MPASQSDNGKAFEYACACSIAACVRNWGITVGIVENEPFHTAQRSYCNSTDQMRASFDAASEAAVHSLFYLEPRLTCGDALQLELQSDAAGMRGDVRDVLCRNVGGAWEIGLSCKHNNDAVKHSRLSATIDFGADWFGKSCSPQYFDEVGPVFEALQGMRSDALAKGGPVPEWNTLSDKEANFYVPVLNAFVAELKRLNASNPDEIPASLVRYLIGERDFYKVASDDSSRLTRITAFNFDGSLFRSAKGKKSTAPSRKLKLPTKILWAGLLPGSTNKVEVHCDEGWAMSMRIHNASSRIEPSLKFDVRLVGQPAALYTEVVHWDA